MVVVRRMKSKRNLRFVSAAAAISVALILSLLSVSPASATPAASSLAQQAQCGTAHPGANLRPSLTVSRSTIGLSETATVTVTGKDYLQPVHRCDASVPGGIYVFFGWVSPDGRWGPSHRGDDGPTSTRGIFGYTFSYPGEGGGEETREDDTGAIRFVSFSKNGESAAATDYHMDANGGWTTTVTIRGAAYGFVNVIENRGSVVDCTQVQCGIFTIGGHGISSELNEVFTPINFVDQSGAPATPGSGTPNANTGGGGNVGQPGQGGAIANVDPNLVQDPGQGIDFEDLENLADTDDFPDTDGADGDATGESNASEIGAVGVGGQVGQGGRSDVEVTTEAGADTQAAGAVDFGSQGGGTPWGIVIAVIVVLAGLLGGGIAFARKRGAPNTADVDV